MYDKSCDIKYRQKIYKLRYINLFYPKICDFIDLLGDYGQDY